MNQAGMVLDLSGTPTWVLWVIAMVGCGVFAGVVFWMMPPALRKGSGRNSVLSGAGLFFVWAALSDGSRGILWFGAVGCTLVAIPLLWMGKLPSDMPSAQDPDSREHPQYKQVERRGRIAGIDIVFLVLLMIVLTEVFVRGL